MVHTVYVPVEEQKYKLLHGIPYSTVSKHGAPLTLNILMPDNRPPAGAPLPEEMPLLQEDRFPLLVYLAGGGFRFTDKDSWIPMLTWFCRKGYVVATVDYRCSDEAKFPAAVQDVKCALRFLRAHAAEYEIDPQRIALMGDSAGGYLSVMTAATNGAAQFETAEYAEYSSRVQCVCDWFGPVDFLALNDSCEDPVEDHNASDSPESQFLGAPLPEIPELCRVASPLTHLGQDMAPTIIFHGTSDHAVGPKQSIALYDALKQAGIPADLYLIEGAAHVGPEFSQPEILARIHQFFEIHWSYNNQT